MATISGGEVRLFLSTDGTTYKAFASETECSFEMNAETREVTSKDVAVFRSYVTSAKTWSVSGTMLLGDDDASSWNPDELYSKVGDVVYLRITQVAAGGVTPVSGETKIEGQAILTQLSVSAPDKDNGSVSFTLNGTGAFTVGTN
ncbi:MAG: phage tail tube protein [Schleiferiaceae bacterium]